MLSTQALEDFKRIYREEHGAEIPDDIAQNIACALLTIVNTIYRPIRSEWKDEYDYEITGTNS